MATISKRGKYQYQAKVRLKGHPIQSKTFTTRQQAHQWAAAVESEMRRGIFVDRRDLESLTLGDALYAYLTDIVPGMRSQVSVKARVKMWLAHPLAMRPLATLKTIDFLNWMRQRITKVSPGTARRDLAIIGAALKMVRHDWNLPMQDGLLSPVLGKLKVNRKGGCRLGPGEEERLLEKAHEYSTEAAACILLALETGMRRSELCHLRWDQVDLQSRVIHLRDGETKSGFGRRVPLTTRGEELLKTLPRSLGGRVFTSFTRPDSISQFFIRIRKRAGLHHLRFHDLRHEAASRMAPAMPTATLAKIMGWESIEMAMRYYKPDDCELVKSVRQAEQQRIAA